MISKTNFEQAVPQLREQHKKSLDYKRENWDTFVGWQKQQRKIIKNEKGYSVKIAMPVKYCNKIVYRENNNGELVPVFNKRKHHLFHISQTKEVA